MHKLLQHIFPFDLQQSFPDNALLERYNEWDKPARQIQISAVTFLTALLFIVFSSLEKYWASVSAQEVMLKVHLLIMVPLLLTISFLAFKKRFYKFVMYALAASPVISALCHVYIASKLISYELFVTESYLCVFWIFVVSGMTFRYALISASSAFVIFVVSYFYFIPDGGSYLMHVFWISCSFSFGFLAALVFDRSRKTIFMNQQVMHQLAITDPLTGLFNRNQFDSVVDQEIERGLRYHKTFGVLILDVDYFKSVNDTFGHNEGDKVLQKIAKILSTSVRENDTLIRWGGEEFVVVAIEVDQQSLTLLSDKLRKNIEAENYGVAGKITVSVGATLFRKNDLKTELISRADKALYEAKAKGRNTMVYSG